MCSASERLELAAWYRFQPRPVAVARGNEKGRVERAIRFVRERFLRRPALRGPLGLEHPGALPVSRRGGRTALSGGPGSQRHPCEERLIVRAAKTPYVLFDLNDYSIPHTHVRRTLEVLAGVASIRAVEGATVLAVHPRSFDRRQQIDSRPISRPWSITSAPAAHTARSIGYTTPRQAPRSSGREQPVYRNPAALVTPTPDALRRDYWP